MKVHHAKAHGESIAKEEYECSQCSATIKRHPSKATTDEVFCNHQCRANWESENCTGENHPRYNRVEYECDWCGEVVEKTPSTIERNENNFCSKVCSASWKENSEQWEENTHPCWDGGKDEYECDWCDEVFTRQGYQLENTDVNFCGMECFREWHSDTLSGVNHPNWKDESQKVEVYGWIHLSVLW
jgi:hypothetical protein